MCVALCFPTGEEASLPIKTGGSYQVLVNNVFYFTQRVVDKLWQGMFNKESKLVVDFIVQLITQVSSILWSHSRGSPLKRQLCFHITYIKTSTLVILYHFLAVYCLVCHFNHEHYIQIITFSWCLKCMLLLQNISFKLFILNFLTIK